MSDTPKAHEMAQDFLSALEARIEASDALKRAQEGAAAPAPPDSDPPPPVEPAAPKIESEALYYRVPPVAPATPAVPEPESRPAEPPEEASAAKPAKAPPPDYHQHRDRLRAKLDRRGAEAFEDYELLELLLFQVLPRIDTRPLAKRLIKRFGTLAEVVAAPVDKLVTVEGVGPATARHLKLLYQVSVRVGQSSVLDRPVLSSWNALLSYVRSAMQFEGREQFRVLFLNQRNRLAADEVMSRGTVDRAAVYPREIVRRALVHDATAIILVHNHPSGDPTPSPQDEQLTKAIVETCRSINVTVHDHLVVGREDVASFKMLGLM